jgi:heme-degrading monooxygenase HmoA
MFAVIYRSYVKPGRESEYKKLWHQVAQYFNVKNRLEAPELIF